MRAMILAAGLGTRLRPLSDHCAKPALPVRGRPVISLLLALLARHGIREVLINLHHLPETIRRAVEREPRPELEITWSEEPRPLGTGGGIRRAADFLRGTPDCVVLAGDMLLDVDLTALARAHRERGRDVTLLLRDDPRGADFGTLGIDERDRVTRIGSRSLAGAAGPEVRQGLFTGVRFFDREALDAWPEAEAFEDLRDWLAPRIEAGAIHVGAELVDAGACVWEPVGTPAEYLAANLEPPALPSLGGAPEAWSGPLRREPATRNVISASARIDPDAHLEDCVVWEDEHVPAGFQGRRGIWANDGFHAIGNGPDAPAGLAPRGEGEPDVEHGSPQ